MSRTSAALFAALIAAIAVVLVLFYRNFMQARQEAMQAAVLEGVLCVIDKEKLSLPYSVTTSSMATIRVVSQESAEGGKMSRCLNGVCAGFVEL